VQEMLPDPGTTQQRRATLTGEQFQYGFKGARSAPRTIRRVPRARQPAEHAHAGTAILPALQS